MTSKEARLHPKKLDFKKYQEGRKNAISGYAILKDGIVLKYQDTPYYYLYTFMMPGIEHVEQMITRAENGQKLNTYVSQNVKDSYDDKWIRD